MVVEWIKANVHQFHAATTEGAKNRYVIGEEELDEARFNFRDVSKQALDIGSDVHKAVENWFKTGKEPIVKKPEVLSAFVAFLEWADEHEIETIDTELTVFNARSAGTLDWVGKLDSKSTVLDLKTSKAIYPEYRIQIAAYRYLYNLNNPDDQVEASGILRLDKETGLPEYKDVSKFYEQDLKTWRCMVDLFYARHPAISRRINS
jgi:hypothetical protein